MEKAKKIQNIVSQVIEEVGGACYTQRVAHPLGEISSASIRDSIPLLILNMTLQSAFIYPMADKHYNPINLLIISQSGSGKSRLIETLRNLDFVYYCEDITPKHLIEFLELIKSGKKKYLAMPDFNSVLHAHGQKTQWTTMSILREIMSDGITNLASYGMEFKSDFKIKAGIITAITVDNYNEFSMSWKKSGWLNRFLPYSSRLSNITKDEILHTIFYNDEKRFINPKPYNIVKHPKPLILDGRLMELLKDDAEKLALNSTATPFRDAIKLEDLLTSFMVIQGYNILTVEHVLAFKKVIKYCNFEFNEV